MKLRDLWPYAIILAFLGWCLVAFRADLEQLRFAPVWAARDAVLLAALLSLLNYVLRALRWRFYLQRLGHRLPSGFAGLTYVAGFAFTLSPGKVGEMMRAHYYRDAGVPLSTTAAAFFAERLLDLLAMLALATLLLASHAEYAGAIWIAAALVAAVLAVLALSPWERIAGVLEQQRRLPPGLRDGSRAVVRALVSARQLLSPGLLIGGFLLGVVAWGAEGIGLMVIGGIAPAVAIDAPTAIGIYAVAIIIGALSFLPGGLGSTEAVMIALLAAHGYALPDAILLTLVCRLLTLWFAVVLGWIAVAMLRRKSLTELPRR